MILPDYRGGRLVVASNRGPYTLSAKGLRRERSIGGLVSSVLPMVEHTGGVWIASGEPAGRFQIPEAVPRFELRHLKLTAEQLQGYYYGFANNALWPLCHSFLGRVRYERNEWETYEAVNRLFAQAILDVAREGDTLWVHDYQLARVPYYVRQTRPEARLLFFWHIPFPAEELYRTLPWREALLEGLLACDVVGFHINEYAQNFIEAAGRLLGTTTDNETVTHLGRATRVIARPIGIDTGTIERQARTARTRAVVQRLRQTLGEQVLLLGVERLDYTKGIVERLRGVERLLENSPGWRGKFSLIQIVTPSRNEVEAYRQKKREVDETVGRINGRFSDGAWIPIRYLHRAFSTNELIGYYRAADIALVTPLRDGLNLVAKEFVAARVDEDGVVIVSEFAGVAEQLPEALVTNPYSTDDLAAVIERALTMSRDEQRRRMQPMRERVRAQDIHWWTRQFLELE